MGDGGVAGCAPRGMMGTEAMPPHGGATAARLKVAFATVGCKVNQYDTAAMKTFLARHDCSIVPFAEQAHAYIVNSCTVTDRADAESRRLARRAKRLNPRARVILTGCFAQTNAQQAAAVCGVDYVVGIGRLPDILRAVRDELASETGRILVDDLRKARRVGAFGAELFHGQTRAFLKVQEGCDLFCSFCVVPFARGRSRSVEPRRVLSELGRLAERGYKEVVLSGVHLGSYGQDLVPASGLAALVEMIAQAAPVPRIRLSSIDPQEITPRLLGLVARSEVLCPHWHIPVQAGSDPVLRRMRRQYDSGRIREVVAEIVRVLPEAGLGTDLIAGFPGESEDDFTAGFELLAGLPFTYFHVFPYSRRAGTPAAKARDPVPRATAVARARALRQLGAAKRHAFTARCVGRELSVLVEGRRDRDSGELVGYSRNYLRVILPGPDRLMNSIVLVRGVGLRGDRLMGTLVVSAHEHGTAVGA